MRVAGSIVLAGVLCFATGNAVAVDPPSAEPRIEALLRQVPLVDGHNDLFVHYMDCESCPVGLDAYDIGRPVNGDTDIARWREGKVGAQLLNVFGAKPGTRETLDAFDFLRRLAERYNSDLEIAGSAADVRRIHAQGRIALIPTMEGATRLENSPAMLRTLHRLGLRAVTLAFKTNDLADAAGDAPRHGGLSPKGAEIVREMNRIGVLVDLSHVTHDTMNDVLDIVTAPVIFSHSSARALTDVERNVPDDVLRRLPRNGGIVMVSFVPYFTSSEHARWMDQSEAFGESLHARFKGGQITGEQGDAEMATWQKAHPEPAVGVSAVADHIEHIRRIAGVDHVGLGSDFDGISAKVVGLEDVSKFPAVLGELARRGWSDEDLGKLVGENFLRVMQDAERASARPSGG